MTRRPDPHTRGFVYELTDAGRELQTVCGALGIWGARWLDSSAQLGDKPIHGADVR